MAFAPKTIPTHVKDYHSSCQYLRTRPDLDAEQGVPAVHIHITFEEALRLSLAIQAALMNLNRYNRATIVGREMGLRLSIMTGGKQISVNEQRFRQEKESNAG